MPFRGLDTSEIEVRPCLHCLVRKTSQSNSLDQELFPGLLCCVPLSFSLISHVSKFTAKGERTEVRTTQERKETIHTG